MTTFAVEFLQELDAHLGGPRAPCNYPSCRGLSLISEGGTRALLQ